MKYVLCIATVLCTLLSQAQSTWHISPSGNDNNSGLNAEEAFATINHAINLAACGDSIYVLGGEYTEKINAYLVCPENNRIIIQGDVSDRPVITGDPLADNSYAIGATGEGFRFRHFELTSPFPEECDPSNMVIVGRGNHFDFIDVHVHHSGYDGIKTIADCETNNLPIDWKIIDSTIENCGLGCPDVIVNGDGIDFTFCQNCLIENSVIKNNKGHQLQVKLQAYNVHIENSWIEGKHMVQLGLLGNSPQCNADAFNADSVVFRENVLFAKGDTSDFVFKMADIHRLYIENNTVIKDSIDVNAGFICFGGCAGNDNWQTPPTAPVIIRNNIFFNHVESPFFAGPDTSFFDPLEIADEQITMDYNCFFDLNGEYINVPLGDVNSIIADPKFCDYPYLLTIDWDSPCVDIGQPFGMDLGAFQNMGPCELTAPNFEDETFRFFPNPSHSSLNLYVPKQAFGGYVEIYNSSGLLILKEAIRKRQIIISIDQCAAGLHIITLRSSNGELVASNTFIKQ